MNIAIAGTGRMAHARAVAFREMDDVSIVAVRSRSADRAAEFITEHDLPGAHPAQWEDVLGERSIDAVIVTGPNGVHADDACAVLDAGKHLFLEYPPATTGSDAERIVKAVERSRQAVHVGLTHRYGARHRVRKSLFGGSGELGTVVSFQRSIASGNPISRWYDDDELSGGMFVASLYHFLDEARSFFGEVITTHGRYWSNRDEDGVIRSDCGAVSLEHESGSFTQIVYARGMAKPGIGSRTVAIFADGYFIEDDAGARLLSADGERPLVEEADDDAMYADSRAFVDLVSSGGLSDGTLEESVRTLKLAEAVQNSAV